MGITRTRSRLAAMVWGGLAAALVGCGPSGVSADTPDGDGRHRTDDLGLPRRAGLGAEEVRRRLREPPRGDILLGAHRGDWRRHPENSLAAIASCIDMGLDIVEVDVRRTADGELILMHDETLDRTTTGTGRVDAHTLDEIRSLRLTNPHGVATSHAVPTLREAMELARGRVLMFLDKANPWAAGAEAVLRETGTTGQAIFFASGSAAEVRAELGGLADGAVVIPRLKPGMADLTARVEDLRRGLAPRAWAVWYDSEAAPTFPLIAGLRARGEHVWVSTLWPDMCAGLDDDASLADPDAGWGRVIGHGASMILTDRPAAMVLYLESRGLRVRPRRPPPSCH